MAITSLALAQGMNENDPYAQPDDSWISISGTVVDPKADRFTLDYGEGLIGVEMDDWDSYGDAYGLLDGDKVTVYGRVDDDLFEVATIEAGSVYVENLNTYFYASSDDEEGSAYSPYFWTAETPLTLSMATIRGTVTSVDEFEREFTIDTGLQEITVETAYLGYNPLDNVGFQQIDIGDRVSVTGKFDLSFIEGREFDADSVITLSDASRDS
jgi:uncharacterized protein YdeI (BOF family)